MALLPSFLPSSHTSLSPTMQRSILLLALVALLAAVASADNRGLSTHFSADTKAAFKATLASAQPFTSLESAALGVSALKRLGESVAHKADLCSLASSELSSDKPQSVEAIFYASELRQALACTGGAKQASKAVADVLRNAIDEASSLSNLLHASKALLTLNKAALLPPNSFTPADLSVVIAHVAEAFASELPIEAYGHGFAAAALAAANSNSRSETDETSFDLIAEAVGDVLGRGIELEDGSVVFYDSGDSSTAARTTAALLSGIASLAAAKPDIELPSVRRLSLSLSLSCSLATLLLTYHLYQTGPFFGGWRLLCVAFGSDQRRRYCVPPHDRRRHHWHPSCQPVGALGCATISLERFQGGHSRMLLLLLLLSSSSVMTHSRWRTGYGH